jgi:hypothetical protein
MQLCNEPSDCPEYVRCEAPICPLDKDWLLRVYSRGESTCLFLRESVKEGAEARLSSNPVYAELHAIAVKWLAAEEQVADKRTEAGMPRCRGDHLRTVRQAADTGSVLDNRAAASERLAATRKAKAEARDAGP